jgi:Kef-type K+ transport system membrane component KefB
MSVQIAAACAVVPLALVVASRLLGLAFERLHQPRVAGEIAAGFLIQVGIVAVGSTLLQPGLWPLPESVDFTLSGVAWLGGLVLMFIAGAEMRPLLEPEERRRVGLMAALGDGVPFVVVAVAALLLPLDNLMGSASNKPALVMIVAISAAVTSVPVISKIFSDLGILRTRFASIVLGVGVLGDTALWALLAIATGLIHSATLAPIAIGARLVLDIVLLVGGLRFGPSLVRAIAGARWNLLARRFPSAFLVTVCVAYVALASAAGISVVFGGFLAGIAVAQEQHLRPIMRGIRPVGVAALVPAYFAIAGFRLDLLGGAFPVGLFVIFLAASSALKIISMMVSAQLAGFRIRDALNIAITTNARGGPGIIVATVTRETGIIGNEFYTVLVLTAVVTSQLAGAWLALVVRRGWSLLEGQGREQVAVGIDVRSRILPLADQD